MSNDDVRETSPREAGRAGVATVLAALAADAILIVVFAALGRADHELGLSVGAVLTTSWPFLAGLAISWLAFLVWRRPLSLVRSGVPVWLGTVAIGLLLRVVTGRGIALPFVVVALIALGVFFLGWRGIAAILTSAGRSRRSVRLRARASRPSSQPSSHP